MTTAKLFDKTICKCERCGHIWIPKSDAVYTCPKCRSPYWNKQKGKSNIKELEVPILLDTEAQKKAALQCAIFLNFDCLHYKERNPATALCTTCFECDFWNTDKVKMLKEAFNEPESPEIKTKIKVHGDEVSKEFDDIQKQSTENDNKDLPKTPDEILASLEQREIKIVGREKTANKEDMKILCYSCREKYQDDNNNWQCNFFTFKSAPKYDYCRLCWELAEIWGERAAGLKK